MDPMALAILAAQTIVAAASTDAWDALKRGVARLVGRGNAHRERQAEKQLDQAHGQLQADPGQEQTRSALEAAWQARLFSLLEAEPSSAADLLALVERTRAELPAKAITAVDHGVATGNDVNVTASYSGVAAGVIHGSVSTGNPTDPDPATR
jgi:hypothetical protein